jgi:hypothetical protein
MSLEPVVSNTAGTTDAETPPPYAVVSTEVTPIMPPGYTETETTHADGVVTTVTTNAAGGTVDTIYGTSTMPLSEPQISVWA